MLTSLFSIAEKLRRADMQKLIKERDRVISDMRKLDNKILGVEEDDICPSATLSYAWYIDYLEIVGRFLKDRISEKKAMEELLEAKSGSGVVAYKKCAETEEATVYRPIMAGHSAQGKRRLNFVTACNGEVIEVTGEEAKKLNEQVAVWQAKHKSLRKRSLYLTRTDGRFHAREIGKKERMTLRINESGTLIYKAYGTLLNGKQGELETVHLKLGRDEANALLDLAEKSFLANPHSLFYDVCDALPDLVCFGEYGGSFTVSVFGDKKVDAFYKKVAEVIGDESAFEFGIVVQGRFYKNEKTDKVWWLRTDRIGEFVFSFDKKTTFNLFADYPWKLTQEQKRLFDKENPDWANYFKDRV